MRKHLLRILTVLLIVCLGACLFAACDDEGENGGTEAATYTLTYTANGGTGEDITESHKEGDEVVMKGADTFTRDGYVFTGWSDGSEAVYGPGDKFSMPAQNVTMQAQWQSQSGTEEPPAAKTYTVTMEENANAVFRLIAPTAEGPFAANTVVRFTVTAADGYKIVSVKNGTTVLNPVNGAYSVTVIDQNIVIKVETAEEGTTPPPQTTTQYTVTLNMTGNGNSNTASLDKSGKVDQNTEVTLTLTVASGYKAEVKVNGTAVTVTGNTYKFKVTQDTTVSVAFTQEGTTPPPQTTTQYTVTLSMTGNGNGNTASLDKSGKVDQNTEVTLTLTVASGYKAEVKVNGTAVTVTGNAYKFKVTQDTTVSVAFTQEGVTPPPQSNKNFTQFFTSDIQRLDGERFQIAIQAKADGYQSIEEMKGDVKLLIGTQEFSVNVVTLADSGIYNLFFPVEAAQLTIANDGSASVKLKSVAANKEYCPATAVNETLNSVQFEHDIYTLQYAANALTLKHTYVQTVEKKITFKGSSFEFDNGESKIYLMINMQTQGYEKAEVLAAKLEVGTLEFAARGEGVSTKSLLRFDLTGGAPSVESLAAGQVAVVLVVGGVRYECPTSQKGQIGQQKMGGRTFTLKEEGDKLYLVAEGGAGTDPSGPSGPTDPSGPSGPSGPTDPSGKGYTNFFNANMVYLNDTSFDLYLRVSQTGFASVDEIKNDLKLIVGTVTIDCAHVDPPGKDSDIYVAKFTLTVAGLGIADGSSAEVRLKSVAANREYPCPASYVDDNQKSIQMDHDFYTLAKEGDSKLTLTHKYEENVEKTLAFAGTVFLDIDDGRIVIGICLASTTYTEDELKTATLEIGGLTFTADNDTNKGAIRFSVYGGNVSVGTLTGKQEVILKLDGKTYKGATVLDGQIEKSIERDGKTFTLTAEGKGDGKAIYLTIE